VYIDGDRWGKPQVLVIDELEFKSIIDSSIVEENSSTIP
jgi:hypothetical protein